MNIIFETERLFVRPYSEDDFEYFFVLNSDEEVMRYIRPAQNREKARDFFEQIRVAYDQQPGLGRWAMFSKNENEYVGSFAVIPVPNAAGIQLGYALLKKYWGNGYASESVKAGINYAFDTLGLESIAGITEVANTGSQKVLLKNGFIFEKLYEEEGKQLFLYTLNKINRING